jgi:hypothetical protein
MLHRFSFFTKLKLQRFWHSSPSNYILVMILFWEKKPQDMNSRLDFDIPNSSKIHWLYPPFSRMHSGRCIKQRRRPTVYATNMRLTDQGVVALRKELDVGKQVPSVEELRNGHLFHVWSTIPEPLATTWGATSTTRSPFSHLYVQKRAISPLPSM